MAPASQLGAVVARCVAAVEAGAAADAADATAYTGIDSGAVGGPGDDKAWRIASACRAAQDHFHALESVEVRLCEAEEIRLHLPDINVAAYATDETVWRDVIRRLARCASGAAFELAQALAGASMTQPEGARAFRAQPADGGRAANAATISVGSRAAAGGGGAAAVEDLTVSAVAGAAEPRAASVEAVRKDAGDGAVVEASGGAAGVDHGESAYRSTRADQVAEAAKVGREAAEVAGGEAARVATGTPSGSQPAGALDAWELRMERADAIIWETVRAAEAEPDSHAAIAADAAPRTAALVVALRSAAAEHLEALLAQPARLSVQLATATLRQSGGESCPAVLLCAFRPAMCPALHTLPLPPFVRRSFLRHLLQPAARSSPSSRAARGAMCPHLHHHHPVLSSRQPRA